MDVGSSVGQGGAPVRGGSPLSHSKSPSVGSELLLAALSAGVGPDPLAVASPQALPRVLRPRSALKRTPSTSYMEDISDGSASGVAGPGVASGSSSGRSALVSPSVSPALPPRMALAVAITNNDMTPITMLSPAAADSPTAVAATAAVSTFATAGWSPTLRSSPPPLSPHTGGGNAGLAAKLAAIQASKVAQQEANGTPTGWQALRSKLGSPTHRPRQPSSTAIQWEDKPLPSPMTSPKLGAAPSPFGSPVASHSRLSRSSDFSSPFAGGSRIFDSGSGAFDFSRLSLSTPPPNESEQDRKTRVSREQADDLAFLLSQNAGTIFSNQHVKRKTQDLASMQVVDVVKRRTSVAELAQRMILAQKAAVLAQKAAVLAANATIIEDSVEAAATSAAAEPSSGTDAPASELSSAVAAPADPAVMDGALIAEDDDSNIKVISDDDEVRSGEEDTSTEESSDEEATRTRKQVKRKKFREKKAERERRLQALFEKAEWKKEVERARRRGSLTKEEEADDVAAGMEANSPNKDGTTGGTSPTMPIRRSNVRSSRGTTGEDWALAVRIRAALLRDSGKEETEEEKQIMRESIAEAKRIAREEELKDEREAKEKERKDEMDRKEQQRIEEMDKLVPGPDEELVEDTELVVQVNPQGETVLVNRTVKRIVQRGRAPTRSRRGSVSSLALPAGDGGSGSLLAVPGGGTSASGSRRGSMGLNSRRASLQLSTAEVSSLTAALLTSTERHAMSSSAANAQAAAAGGASNATRHSPADRSTLTRVDATGTKRTSGDAKHVSGEAKRSSGEMHAATVKRTSGELNPIRNPKRTSGGGGGSILSPHTTRGVSPTTTPTPPKADPTIGSDQKKRAARRQTGPLSKELAAQIQAEQEFEQLTQDKRASTRLATGVAAQLKARPNGTRLPSMTPEAAAHSGATIQSTNAHTASPLKPAGKSILRPTSTGPSVSAALPKLSPSTEPPAGPSSPHFDRGSSSPSSLVRRPVQFVTDRAGTLDAEGLEPILAQVFGEGRGEVGKRVVLIQQRENDLTVEEEEEEEEEEEQEEQEDEEGPVDAGEEGEMEILVYRPEEDEQEQEGDVPAPSLAASFHASSMSLTGAVATMDGTPTDSADGSFMPTPLTSAESSRPTSSLTRQPLQQQHQEQQPQQEQEHLLPSLKCVLVGDDGVGKTSLSISYTTPSFPPARLPTVFDTYSASVVVDGQPVQVALWDTAGAADYDRVRPHSYANADVFLLCFSIGSLSSFESLQSKWLFEVQYHARRDVPIVLVGCQGDLRPPAGDAQQRSSPKEMQLVSPEAAWALQQQMDAIAYVECSAVTRDGVRDVLDQAIRGALAYQAVVRESGGSQMDSPVTARGTLAASGASTDRGVEAGPVASKPARATTAEEDAGDVAFPPRRFLSTTPLGQRFSAKYLHATGLDAAGEDASVYLTPARTSTLQKQRKPAPGTMDYFRKTPANKRQPKKPPTESSHTPLMHPEAAQAVLSQPQRLGFGSSTFQRPKGAHLSGAAAFQSRESFDSDPFSVKGPLSPTGRSARKKFGPATGRPISASPTRGGGSAGSQPGATSRELSSRQGNASSRSNSPVRAKNADGSLQPSWALHSSRVAAPRPVLFHSAPFERFPGTLKPRSAALQGRMTQRYAYPDAGSALLGGSASSIDRLDFEASDVEATRRQIRRLAQRSSSTSNLVGGSAPSVLPLARLLPAPIHPPGYLPSHPVELIHPDNPRALFASPSVGQVESFQVRNLFDHAMHGAPRASGVPTPMTARSRPGSATTVARPARTVMPLALAGLPPGMSQRVAEAKERLHEEYLLPTDEATTPDAHRGMASSASAPTLPLSHAPSMSSFLPLHLRAKRAEMPPQDKAMLVAAVRREAIKQRKLQRSASSAAAASFSHQRALSGGVDGTRGDWLEKMQLEATLVAQEKALALHQASMAIHFGTQLQGDHADMQPGSNRGASASSSGEEEKEASVLLRDIPLQAGHVYASPIPRVKQAAPLRGGVSLSQPDSVVPSGMSTPKLSGLPRTLEASASSPVLPLTDVTRSIRTGKTFGGVDPVTVHPPSPVVVVTHGGGFVPSTSLPPTENWQETILAAVQPSATFHTGSNADHLLAWKKAQMRHGEETSPLTGSNVVHSIGPATVPPVADIIAQVRQHQQATSTLAPMTPPRPSYAQTMADRAASAQLFRDRQLRALAPPDHTHDPHLTIAPDMQRAMAAKARRA